MKDLTDIVDAGLTQAIWMQEPAPDWNSALPIGNGRLGAMIFGNVHDERIALNEDSLCSGTPAGRAAIDGRPILDDVRRLAFDRDFVGANEACKQLQGPFTQSYQTLGDLALRFKCPDSAVTNYRRKLALSTATASVEYTIDGVDYRRTLIASHPANAIVIHLTATAPVLSFDATFASPLRSTVDIDTGVLRLTGRADSHMEPDYSEREWPAADPDESVRFTALLASTSDGEVTASGDTLTVRGATWATLYLTAATSFAGFDK